MRLSPIVGWIAVLAVACGGRGADTAATDPPEASTTIPPSSTTDTEDGFVPPASPTLDPGVATDVEVPATEAEVAAFGDRHNLPPTREGTVDLRLARCRLVSPGRYAFDGHVTLDGVEQVRVGLSLTGWEGLPQIVTGNVDPMTVHYHAEGKERLLDGVAELLGQALPPGTPPTLTDAAVTMIADCDSDRCFDDGLELMLAGLNRAQPQRG